jgi:uncharacterized delta-60 repeat protein
VALTLCAVALAQAGPARAGTVLDSGFGINGVMTDPSLPGGAGALPTKVAVQPDGRVVVAGTTTNYVPFVARYLQDGRADPSFGDGGVARLAAETLQTTGLAIAPDGSVVIAGTADFPSTTLSDMAVARLTPAGRLDPSFGGTGIVRLERGDYEGAGALAVGPDGKILVAGITYYAGAPNIGSVLVVRLTPGGQRDPGFGTNGEITLATPSRPDVLAMALAPDGHIWVSGSVPNLSAGTPGPALLARITQAGQPDSGFGVAGVRVNDSEFNSPFSGLAVDQSDGVLVAGRLAVIRVSSAGVDGASRAYNAALQYADVAVLPNGRVVVAGTIDHDPAPDSYRPNFFVARYQPDLGPDSSFTPSDAPVLDVDGGIARDIAAAPDGGAVIAGAGGYGTSTVLARLHGSGQGYWMLGATGAVHAFGAAPVLPPVSMPAGVQALDLDPVAGGRAGYRILTTAGGVLTAGDAPQYPMTGSFGSTAFGDMPVSISATPTGKGYWVFTSQGRVRTFGDAQSFGDMAGTKLNAAVIDSVATPSGRGYYMVASDGGIFSFGDAAFHGSMGATLLNAPVRALVPDPDGRGYWLVASDGGIFAFDAPFRGSMGQTPLNQPVTGMVAFGDAYLMVASDGGTFNFSSLPFFGSLGGNRPPYAIKAIAAFDESLPAVGTCTSGGLRNC